MDTTNKMTLKAGLLISLSSTVSGGVAYARKDLDKRCAKDGKDAMGADAACKLLEGHGGPCNFAALTPEEVTRWETTRTIADKEEHKKATEVRNKARTLITGVTVASNFGNLCPIEHEAELDERYRQAKAMVDEFNNQSQHTRVGIYMLKAVIPDNVQSAAAISGEVVSLIDAMISGISQGDEDEVRKAANSLTELVEILDPSSKAVAEKAITEARSAARAIVKANKEAEAAAGQQLGGQQSIAQQKSADKGDAAKKTLKSARKALDLSGDVFAAIEQAAAKDKKAS